MKALGVVLFAVLTAAGAQVSLPMVPVPMTLQSLAVVLAGGALGPRLGVAAMLLYLGAAALGLPVLSEGRSGIEALTGPTAGYLAGFVLAAWACGAAGERGWLLRPVMGIGVLSAAHLLILLPGAAWLAHGIGWTDALEGGVAPFLIGAAVKASAAWLILRGLRTDRRRDRPGRTPAPR
ncbi:biotin transporter BioY [Brevundimonas sp. NIBR11]|uniref:biotin transporter BioY n=1 Tax=Brevundimonas sp. NIBR11 TaxID=3015999 RepID=UPI0022F0CA82|nr:biotin transporter BioY [Brevundimonas sp. NIBR11]WGM32418.1 Biotin transporter BioY [Brevundimonas sp. NIBR11]